MFNTLLHSLLPHNMAAQGTETPTVHVDLDDSELTRLEKLRIRLKLTHWSKITRKNKLRKNLNWFHNRRGRKVNMLYFWFLIRLAGNCWVMDCLPTQMVRA